MSDVASRLETRLREWDGTKTELSARLNEAGVRGYTRKTINDYLSGHSKPSVEWVRAAASILGVRESWLAFGEGPKRKGAPRRGMDPKRDLLEDELDWFAGARRGIQSTFLDLLHWYDHRMSRKEHPGEGDGPEGRPFVERAKDLTAILLLPVVVWGYEYPEDLPTLPDGYWEGVMSALLRVEEASRIPAKAEYLLRRISSDEERMQIRRKLEADRKEPRLTEMEASGAFWTLRNRL